MESPGAVGRRRGTSRSNVEDQALDQIAKEVSQSIQSFFYSTPTCGFRTVFFSRSFMCETGAKLLPFRMEREFSMLFSSPLPLKW